jgi:hypothetical protein
MATSPPASSLPVVWLLVSRGLIVTIGLGMLVGDADLCRAAWGCLDVAAEVVGVAVGECGRVVAVLKVGVGEGEGGGV